MARSRPNRGELWGGRAHALALALELGLALAAVVALAVAAATTAMPAAVAVAVAVAAAGNSHGRRRRRQPRPDRRRQHPAGPARHPPRRKVATLEYSAPWVAGAWLLAWVVNNIGVNILNKSAFQFVDFPYPYALSAVHMLCNYSGAEIYYAVNKSAPQRKVLTPEQFKVRACGAHRRTAKEFQ